MPRKHKVATRKRPVAAAPPPPPAVSPRARWICSAAVFLLVLTVYLCTLQSTVVSRKDNGEMITAAHVLGIVHPTGYPLWTMLAHLFDLLPLGHTSAFRMALLSAVSVAGAAALLTWLIVLLTDSLFSGPFAGLTLRLLAPHLEPGRPGRVLWAAGPADYSLPPRALALGSFSHSPVAPLGSARRRVRGQQSPHRLSRRRPGPPRRLLADAFRRETRLLGWLQGARRARRPLPLLSLPAAAARAAHPAENWGDPETLGRFLTHVLGRQYERYVFQNGFAEASESAAPPAPRQPRRPRLVLLAAAGLGLLFALWGFLAWVRRRPAAILPITLGAVILAVFTLGYGPGCDNTVYLIPVGAVGALLAGLGMARLAEKMPRCAAPYLPAAFAALACALLLSTNWARADLHNDWADHDKWLAALLRVDRNAILICDGDDPTDAVMYLQQVEGRRRDVTLIMPNALRTDWYPGTLGDPELGRMAHDLWMQITAGEGRATRRRAPSGANASPSSPASSPGSTAAAARSMPSTDRSPKTFPPRPIS